MQNFLQQDKMDLFKKATNSVTIASHNLANSIGDYHANMWQFTKAYNQLAVLCKGFEYPGFPKLTPIAEYPFYNPKTRAHA